MTRKHQPIIRKHRQVRGHAMRKMEDALSMYEAKYRTLFEESNDVIFMSTPEGQLIEINPAGLTLFEYGSIEAISEISIEDLFINHEDYKTYQQILSEHGQVKDFEVALRTTTGRTIYVQTTSTSVRDEKGNVFAYRGMIRDVTNLRKLQQQLLQAHKMETVGRFASSLAHDFNNVLTAIGGSCELMRILVPRGGQLHEYIRQVEEAVEKGTSLTRQLLAFNKKQAFSIEQVSLNAVLNGLKTILLRLVGNRVTITFMEEESLWGIRADRAQLEQLIITLALNARDAIGGCGNLVIATENVELTKNHSESGFSVPKGQYVKLTVIDAGDGTNGFARTDVPEPAREFETIYEIVKQSKGYAIVRNGSIYLPRAEMAAI